MRQNSFIILMFLCCLQSACVHRSEQLVAQLHSMDLGTRRAAIKSLREMGKDGVPGLHKGLYSKRVWVRLHALRLLGKTRDLPQPILADVSKLLVDPHPMIREAATQILLQARHIPLSFLLKTLRGPSQNHEAIVDFLGRMGSRAQPATQALLLLLQSSKTFAQRQNVLQALCQIGGANAIGIVSAFLSRSPQQTRDSHAKTLGGRCSKLVASIIRNSPSAKPLEPPLVSSHLTVTGYASRAKLHRAIRKIQWLFDACYSTQRDLLSPPEGKLTIYFVVALSGRLSEFEVTHNSWGTKVSRCVRLLWKSIRFPKPDGEAANGGVSYFVLP